VALTPLRPQTDPEMVVSDGLELVTGGEVRCRRKTWPDLAKRSVFPGRSEVPSAGTELKGRKGCVVMASYEL
jgi:hypothetical protein